MKTLPFYQTQGSSVFMGVILWLRFVGRCSFTFHAMVSTWLLLLLCWLLGQLHCSLIVSNDSGYNYGDRALSKEFYCGFNYSLSPSLYYILLGDIQRFKGRRLKELKTED